MLAAAYKSREVKWLPKFFEYRPHAPEQDALNHGIETTKETTADHSNPMRGSRYRDM